MPQQICVNINLRLKSKMLLQKKNDIFREVPKVYLNEHPRNMGHPQKKAHVIQKCFFFAAEGEKLLNYLKQIMLKHLHQD